jgi:GNAT superfamily N-acetyltransferase
MRIALAAPEHHESLVDLLHELHRYYNASSTLPRETVREHLFGNLLAAESPLRLVVATNPEGQVIGFAALVLLHSLVEPEPEKSGQCLLKELFVSASQRNQGVGYALMAGVARYAAEWGCSRIDWNVNASNSHGIAFYKRLGAEQVGDRLSYRLSHAGINKLSHTGTNAIDA